MSKGWESKNIEEQQAEAAERRAASQTATAAAANEAERKRRVATLELQRERVLSEQTSNPHRRSALQLALATIERDLEQLGWSIKL
jgi:hypothetical protein